MRRRLINNFWCVVKQVPVSRKAAGILYFRRYLIMKVDECCASLTGLTLPSANG